MAVKLVVAACLLVGQVIARADLSILRNQDLWPSPVAEYGYDLTVDLGYGLYQGYNNATSGLNIWKGIRFAAPPTGELRWQMPHVPSLNRTLVNATKFGDVCPQIPAPGKPYAPAADESEDCLFVNVYAPLPPKGKKLPVMIWIHGGGYKHGNGRYDLSEFITKNGNSIIGVQIQYRLGAFGFLSSSDVDAKGAVNAGLLDQVLALSWVQKYISSFGGDPQQVTIAAQSAGAGSIMYHALADDGNTKPSLFRYAFASSTFAALQFPHDSPFSTAGYTGFAKAAGCGNSSSVWDCLVRADFRLLQEANYNMSLLGGVEGLMGFQAVTDGVFIKELLSVQLAKKRVNGERLFVGNNAIEATVLPIQGLVKNKQQFVGLLRQLSPGITADNMTTLLDLYSPAFNFTTTFETDGLSGATANDVSGIAVGYAQTLNNIVAEFLFVCPSYWLASAYSEHGKSAYHYQYSVPIAGHTEDVWAYLGPVKENQGAEFSAAFSGMLSNFVHTGNPSITNEIANGPSSPNPTAKNPASNWPVWNESNPSQINMNTTGGKPITATHSWGTGIEFIGPGLHNSFTTVDAYAWEGGRGKRCDFWREMGPRMPL